MEEVKPEVQPEEVQKEIVAPEPYRAVLALLNEKICREFAITNDELRSKTIVIKGGKVTLQPQGVSDVQK